MNWNNIDLNSHEIDSAIIDEYTFEGLLLEINYNLPEINEDTVRKQFLTSLNQNMEQAKDIFESNLKNILKYAKKERASK
jgi:formiminotetrahydrofolate cyclodeaminase